MPGNWRGPVPRLAAVFVLVVVVILGALFTLSADSADKQALMSFALVALGGAAGLFAVAWRLIDHMVSRVPARMAAEVRAIAHGSTRIGIDAEQFSLLSPLPEAINEMSLRLVQARKEVADGVAGATARAEEGAARLAAILNNLHEGVVVCNLRHQIVLYNQVAFDMLARVGQLGLSRSLFETVGRGPVVHMLMMLTNSQEAAKHAAPFLAGSVDGKMLLQARMTLVRDGDGAVTGYVVTLVDAGLQTKALGRREALLRDLAEGLETSLTRLRAADGDPQVIERQAATIDRAVKRAAEGYRRALSGWWPMADLSSADLFGFVVGRFENNRPKVTITGLPVGLHGDSHSLVMTLVSLVTQIASQTGTKEVDLTAGAAATCYADEFAPRAGDEVPWLDIVWQGEPVPESMIRRWLKLPLPALGGLTVRDVLVHHAGDAVTQGRRDGWSWLRLPMRRRREVLAKPKPVLGSRPEFYDMSLLAQARETGGRGNQPLRALTYVVVDTETTGLQPSAGDQIVQIGAVRVVNGRILSGESFNRIVNPGRAIPAESIKFHGITDDMAKDKPPIGVVLPQFKAFATDAVLVAHNAAFDLKFLRMREKECGVTFDNPVLDTMLLSSYLDGPEAGHSLDEICARFGLAITDRHTALGDAMATAAVLLRQIEALEMRGIHTLDQAVKALDLTMVLHERQQTL